MQDRAYAMRTVVANTLEVDLELLGLTGVEDKLQVRRAGPATDRRALDRCSTGVSTRCDAFPQLAVGKRPHHAGDAAQCWHFRVDVDRSVRRNQNTVRLRQPRSCGRVVDSPCWPPHVWQATKSRRPSTLRSRPSSSDGTSRSLRSAAVRGTGALPPTMASR